MIESLPSIYKKALHDTLEFVENRSGSFMTTLSRPKYAEQVETWSDLSPDGGAGTAIVVSGPMVYENHFTRDSIRLYRKYYPHALIILATWDDEDAEYLEVIPDEKTLVMLGKRPEDGDQGRARDQFYAAVQKAAERGVTHVLKTISSHRLYAPNLIDFSKGIQKAFPLTAGHPQKQRIITANHVALKYVPFWINTAVMFGHIHDMFNYWASPDGGHPKLPKRDWSLSLRELGINDSMCYYVKSYLERIGVEFNPNSLRDSWRIIAEQFCVVDCQTLDLFKNIPNRGNERAHIQQYIMRASQRWTFQDWLILNRHPERVDMAPEYVLNEPLMAEINGGSMHD